MNFIILKDPDWQQAIRKWHSELHDKDHRGDRARLRRCDRIDAVMLEPACFRLCQKTKGDTEGLALVAGLLTWVENLSDQPTALLLGRFKPGGDTPLFSELRFRRLLASSAPDDFYQGMRRAIMQLGKTADPIQLADEILHWHAQHKWPDNYQGIRQWRYRMARGYYAPQSLPTGLISDSSRRPQP